MSEDIAVIKQQLQMAPMAMPILPLRDLVIYPQTIAPLFVGREASIAALEHAVSLPHKTLFLVAQKEGAQDDPGPHDVHAVGVVAHILQMLKLPDGTIKILVEGVVRARAESIEVGPCLLAQVHALNTRFPAPRPLEAMTRALLTQFKKYVKVSKKLPQELMGTVASIEEPEHLLDTICTHANLKLEDRQQLLEDTDFESRLDTLMMLMEAEIDLMQIETRIRDAVQEQIQKTQKEHYLHEQLKAIKKELGQDGQQDTEHLKKKIQKAGMPEQARDKALAELRKLDMMPPMSSEAHVVRTYLEALLEVPWTQKSPLRSDLQKAQALLDKQHYGLEKVKTRILEALAVEKRLRSQKKQRAQTQILLLVGPPGVGKTSLAQSIADATGRKYVRFALGGVRDEAEIRGHRRTYIGAMPGKIMQKIMKSGVKNPLFLLDEVDKMSADFRGDPASALLEVLDPEQNKAFSDHYLEVDYDLSEVLFIATANSLNIPAPLLDRMEVVFVHSYTEDEKKHIAQAHLLPKQLEKHGLKASHLSIDEQALQRIIREYTKEAGVRGLERQIATLCRKSNRMLLDDPKQKVISVQAEALEQFLHTPKYRFGMKAEEARIGQVTGMAWTELGGELLTIEAVIFPGDGKTRFTGKLGDVMQESIHTAMSVVRSRYAALHLDADFFNKHDYHVHVPEGATPKDGPSAGIAMVTALASVLTQRAVRSDVAMTGEITLRGEVLAIGGVKEKILAAYRGQIQHIILPHDNMRDLVDIPENIRKELNIHCVRWIDEVLSLALVEDNAMPLSKEQDIYSSLSPRASHSSDNLAV